MVLETERLILRPFRESDAEDVLEYLKEPAVNCFAEMKLNSLEEAKAEMKKRVGETEYYFAIVLKDSAKVIGEIDAFPERGEPHDTSSPLDTFSPCWMLKQHTLFLTICFSRKVQDASTLIQRIIMCRASTFVKNLVCAGRECLKSLYLLLRIPTAHPVMRTLCSMPF